MEARNYISGAWIGGPTLEVFYPADVSRSVGRYSEANEDDVQHAIEAAIAAQAGWKAIGFVERGNILSMIASRIEHNVERLAEIATLEMGKPIGETRGEALRAAAIFRYYSGEGFRSIGDVIPAAKPDTLQYSLREPLGTMAIITPWNFPLAIPAWKIAPALVFGNTIVFKPGELSSLSAFLLVELMADVLPPGVINLVMGKGSTVGEALITHRQLNGISFTGSRQIGQHIAATAVETGVKVQLEMGGKNPVIIADDANLNLAVDMVVSGAFRSAGQKCTATSRVIVLEGVFENFKGLLLDKVASVKLGDPLEADTYLGPVVSAHQREKILGYVAVGARDGARLLTGGEVDPERAGYFVAPTIFEEVQPQDTIAQEEIFGPVIALLKAASVAEAIAIANSVRFGLSASVFTSSLETALRFVDEIDAGMVRVNEETAGVELQAPFGGVKDSSSHSREQGRAAIEFYTRTKTVALRPASGRGVM